MAQPKFINIEQGEQPHPVARASPPPFPPNYLENDPEGYPNVLVHDEFEKENYYENESEMKQI